ncbi:MAG: membrane protein insertase YidC [Anaerolineae bacterium]|nr:membrane protein insertase YidC [Anaerolineae bacterium]
MDLWSLILNPFITVLVFLYQILAQNMVLAIIAFTIIVRLITHPLTIQQQRSSKVMQELQPEMKKLQEKYKNDREKLSQAQMELYRKHGFNPMGGCLPLFIQLPIMIGLYQAIIMALGATPLQLLDLSGRILVPGLELLVPLHNTFLGMNLAQPDPTLILPILVLATSWLSQRMIMPPSTGDDGGQAAAMTRSMSTVMPIMFFFFALNFASGLSIYFVVSNLITMIQYTLMGRADFRNLFGRRQAALDDGKSKRKTKQKAESTSQAD